MKITQVPLLLLAAAVSRPAAAQDSATFTANLKNGKSARIQVLGVEKDQAHLRVFVLGQEAELKCKLSDFVPASAFEIEERAPRPDTYEEHFALAKHAAELELLPQAGAQARAAVACLKNDPKAKEKEADVRAWAALALEGFIQKAVAEGDSEKAQQCLDILTTRLADQRTEEQLTALARSVGDLEARQASEKEAARLAKLETKKKEDVEKRLIPIREKVKAGDEAFTEGVGNSKNTVNASRACEKAIASYKAAWGLAQSLAKSYPDDASIQDELAAFGERLQEKGIRAALHAASVLTTQTDYKAARSWCDRILAFDPDNAEAKEMIKTIQEAATSSDDWRWSWRTRARRSR